jgi:hypothetical protein
MGLMSRCVLAVLVLAFAGCGKDPSLKAEKPECDAACAHVRGLEKADPAFGDTCAATCIQREWTVGDVRCLRGAESYEAAGRCAVVQQHEAEQRKLRAELKAQNDRVERLLQELSDAKDEARRAALQKELEAEPNCVFTAAPPSSGRRPCACEPGDPLCSCL